jgi:hypothetical protein
MKTVKFVSVSIVAFVLAILLLPIGFVFGMVWSIIKKDGSVYIYNVLSAIDQSGCAVLAPLLNLTMLRFWKPEAYLFGNPKEKISSVLGKNKEKPEKVLSWFGKVWCWILNSLQKNHVENAIDLNV